MINPDNKKTARQPYDEREQLEIILSSLNTGLALINKDLTVAWVNFFLRDYGRRIEVASANLFVFIAFSFSLSDNYPRLGYITLLDAVMTVLFVVNALVVVYNVWLRRLEMNEQGELADRIDRYLDWLYPISLVVAAVALYVIFS